MLCGSKGSGRLAWRPEPGRAGSEAVDRSRVCEIVTGRTGESGLIDELLCSRIR